MTGNQPLKVAVCACTYRRPHWLTKMLEGVGKSAFCKLDTMPEVHLVIADNDSGESGRGAIASLSKDYPWPIHYCVETQRSIPCARNLLLTTASGIGADIVAMLDDDEVPEPSWLDEALAALLWSGADIVYGPVVPDYEETPEEWIVQGGFFVRKRWPSGACLDSKYGGPFTGNFVFRMDVVARVGLFDLFWGLHGGEDKDFFIRSRRAGCKAIYCNEAVVHEFTPSDRMHWKWIVQRAFRGGNTDGLLRRRHQIQPRIVTLCIGLVLIVSSLAIFPFVWVAANRGIAMRRVQRAAFGAGLIAGSIGIFYEEYK